MNDPAGFFAYLRAVLGPFSQQQVDGTNSLVAAMEAADWPMSFAAYGLATAWHETAASMQPCEEACYLGDKAAAYRETLRYSPWFGRGYVQLTWQANYEHADEQLGLDGALIANPDMALQPVIAAKILVHGMQWGWFSGRKLSDYLPRTGPANERQFVLARYIINGQDKAIHIADIAMSFQAALAAGGWE